MKEKNKYYLGLAVIFLVALFFRLYHHDQNLFFLLDQARDWRMIDQAIEQGPDQLPLMGPKAGGTDFRLGPVYYYFLYLSALVFGSSPTSLAYPDLLFSLLAIPLFFFFLKEFFSAKISLMLTGLFSFSLFAIEYSRFAWNPNSLPFFILLLFYSLLQISRYSYLPAAEKKTKRIWPWMLALGVSLGIAVQLHTLALVSLPIIVVAYFFLSKTKIVWKQWLIAVLVILILILPIGISEYQKNLKNTKNFWQAIAIKQSAEKEYSLEKKFVRGFQELGRNYFTILTSSDQLQPLKDTKKKGNLISMVQKNILQRPLAVNFVSLLFFLGIILGGYYLLAKEYQRAKGNKHKRNFLRLVFLWQLVYLPIFFSLAFKQDSRYYLLLVFLPFILLGAYLLRVEKYNKYLAYSLVILLVSFNLFFDFRWLKLVDGYRQTGQTASFEEYILENYYAITYDQQRQIVQHLASNYAQDQKSIRLKAPEEQVRSIKYLLAEYEKIPAEKILTRYPDRSKRYYIISNANDAAKRGALPTKFKKNFEVVETREFGNLAVSEVKIKDTVEEVAEPIEYSKVLE